MPPHPDTPETVGIPCFSTCLSVETLRAGPEQALGKSEPMKLSSSAKAVLVTALALSIQQRAPAQTLDPGNAINLNGVNQYAQVQGATNLTFSQLTFEAWVNPHSKKCNTILSKGDGNSALTDFIFQVGYDGSTCGVMAVGFFGGGQWDASTNKVATDT